MFSKRAAQERASSQFDDSSPSGPPTAATERGVRSVQFDGGVDFEEVDEASSKSPVVDQKKRRTLRTTRAAFIDNLESSSDSEDDTTVTESETDGGSDHEEELQESPFDEADDLDVQEALTMELRQVIGLRKKRGNVAVLADIAEGRLSFSGLRLRGGGPLASPATTTTKEPTTSRLLFERREAFLFTIVMKTSRSSTKVLEVGSSTQDEARDWCAFLNRVSFSWESDGNDQTAKEEEDGMQGFLWIKAPKETWNRYYAKIDSTHFEWFSCADVKSYAVKHLSAYIEKQKESNNTSNKSSGSLRQLWSKDDFGRAVHRSVQLSKVTKCNTCLTVRYTGIGSAGATNSASRRFQFLMVEGEARRWLHLLHLLKVSGREALNKSAGPWATPLLTMDRYIRHKSSPLYNSLGVNRMASEDTRFCNQIREVLEKLQDKAMHDYKTAATAGVGDGHYRIISLDGGGVKGILEAVILQRLEKIYPDLLHRTNMFAGVSIGSIVSSLLSYGYTPTTLVEIMKVCGSPMLVRSKAKTLNGLPIQAAKFGDHRQRLLGQEMLKGATLKDVLPKHLLVTNFLLDNELADKNERSWESQIFHNVPQKPRGKSADGSSSLSKEKEETEIDEDAIQSAGLNYFPKALLDTPIWDCVMGSAAAPTYFPSYKGCVDGGVMCNDPSLTAATVVMSDSNLHPVDKSKIHILSLGTGRLPQYIDGAHHDWGLLKWGPYLSTVLLEATNQHVRQLISYLLGDNYVRCNPVFSKPFAMDDASIIPELIQIAEQYDLSDVCAWIEEHWFSEEEKKERKKKKKKMQKLKDMKMEGQKKKKKKQKQKHKQKAVKGEDKQEEEEKKEDVEEEEEEEKEVPKQEEHFRKRRQLLQTRVQKIKKNEEDLDKEGEMKGAVGNTTWFGTTGTFIVG